MAVKFIFNWYTGVCYRDVPSSEGYAEGGGYATDIYSFFFFLHTPPLRGTPLKRGCATRDHDGDHILLIWYATDITVSTGLGLPYPT